MIYNQSQQKLKGAWHRISKFPLTNNNNISFLMTLSVKSDIKYRCDFCSETKMHFTKFIAS